jgi:hypothetical protein
MAEASRTFLSDLAGSYSPQLRLVTDIRVTGRKCPVCSGGMSDLSTRYFGDGELVYRLLDPLCFAAGQLAVFQGGSEAPLSGS